MSAYYFANGSFKFPTEEAMLKALHILAQAQIVKPVGQNTIKTGADIHVFQVDDPEVYSDTAVHWETRTFTLPYGEYLNVPALFEQLALLSDLWAAQYLSEETPIVASLTHQSKKEAIGIDAFETYIGTLTKDEQLAFDLSAWDEAYDQCEDPEQYDDERRFQLTSRVMHRVLQAMET